MARLAAVAAGWGRRADLRAALALAASRARSASRSRSACMAFASSVVMVYMMFSFRSSPPRLAAVHTGDERAAARWTTRGEISAAGPRRGRQRPVPQHVHVIDALRPGGHPSHQARRLHPRVYPAAAAEPDMLCHQLAQASPLRQRHHRHQARPRHQIRVIVGAGKMIAADVSSFNFRWHQNREVLVRPGMSLAGARRLARWCPAWRRREPGLRLLRGTWDGARRYCRSALGVRARGGGREGARTSGMTREALSTEAAGAGGPARSSGEPAVMAGERRAGSSVAGSFGQPGRPGRSWIGELKPPGKPSAISKQEVQEAYQKVKANKGAPGVDGVTLVEFEADLKNSTFVAMPLRSPRPGGWRGFLRALAGRDEMPEIWRRLGRGGAWRACPRWMAGPCWHTRGRGRGRR